jgi:hypothetical protein
VIEMIECIVIDVDINDAEASINAALSTSGITADQFLQAVVLKEESKNNSAKVAIFYEA